jgi:hypothetical protein
MPSCFPNAGGIITYSKEIKATGTPERVIPWIQDTSIAFTNDNPDTITDSNSNFLKRGFASGMKIAVSGSTSNDGNYTIDTVVAGTITLVAGDSLTVEAASATVTIQPVGGSLPIPDGKKVVIAADKDNTGQLYLGNNANNADKASVAAFELDATESVELYIKDINLLWFDGDGNGEKFNLITEF